MTPTDPSDRRHPGGGQRGAVLIALLWILTALAAIAMSFSRESFVEIAAARNTRDLSEAYYAARGGIALTVFRLIERQFTPRVRQLESAVEPPDSLDLGFLSGTLGRTEYRVDIQDESGKLNLNFATEEQLRAVMEVVGIESREANVIVESILDWRDVDNAYHPNGAEDAYYQSLVPPYKAKNGRMDTVEELLLVRGVTKDIFYGMGERGEDGARRVRYGLQRCFTVYGNSPRVNVNFAPLEVLLAVPDMPPEAAKAIFSRRQSQPFASLEEVTRAASVPLPPPVLGNLSTEVTGVYTLTASAHAFGSKATRVIRTVLTLDPREPGGYRVIYWNENVPRL